MTNPKSKSFGPSPKGATGESEVCAYLSSIGYKIIERNWKGRYAELDIVACDKDCLVIIEVKTRLNDSFDTPEEAMTPWKIRSITRAAELYQLTHIHLPEAMRIDFVGVTYLHGKPVFNLIKNITG